MHLIQRQVKMNQKDWERARVLGEALPVKASRVQVLVAAIERGLNELEKEIRRK